MKINNSKNNVSIKSQTGLTLIEIMIAVVLLSLVIAGISEFFSQLKNNTKQQDTQMELSENLRIAMTNITDQLRNSDFAVPGTKLNEWITSGDLTGSITTVNFTDNPVITVGANADDADIITIASAEATPTTFLQNTVAFDATTLPVTNNGTEFNTTGRKLLSINFREIARITGTPSNTALPISTHPSNNQGTRIQNHFQNSPIFQVNVTQYWVNQTDNTLRVNRFDGSGNQVLAEGVKNLKITPVNGSTKHYQVTLTGVSLEVDQDLGTVIEKDLVSEIVILN